MEERVLNLVEKKCIINDIEIKKSNFDISKFLTFLTKLDKFVNAFLAGCMLFGMCWIAACADNGTIYDMVPGFISLSFVGADMLLTKLLYTKYGRKFANEIKRKIRKGR